MTKELVTTPMIELPKPMNFKKLLASYAQGVAKLGELPFFWAVLFQALRHIQYGTMILQLPNGKVYTFKGAHELPVANITVQNWRMARRVVLGGDIGLAESFIDEDWTSPNASTVIEVMAKNAHIATRWAVNVPALQMLNQFKHWKNRNTKAQAEKNIHAHYDLGNSFYTQWLDESMTYSSALFAGNLETPLAQAQQQKYANLAQNLSLTADSKVLEIGCGWGGFAEYVGMHIGADMKCITISREQYDFAKKRIFEKGLADKIHITYQDYRDEHGQYDAIASIEMFEAVGEAYWPEYFDKIHECLKPDGKAGLQIITIHDDLFENYRDNIDFIRRYIFPGGMLPSPTRLQLEFSNAGLASTHIETFGLDYAETLRLWREQFESVWSNIEPLGFDEKFKRLWAYYMHYCEGGFRAGSIDVCQVVVGKV